MSNYVLKLILDAPLQSYGVKSRWDTRDTSTYPSKSAVIGILSCALGYPRGDKRIDELTNNVNVHVRIDKTGNVIEDLQTVNWPIKEYQQKVNWSPKSRNSRKTDKAHNDFHPLLTKMYICDAIFTVFVEGSKEIIERCYNAMINPVWPVYLGRKCCIPASPIVQERPFELESDIETLIKETPIFDMARVLKKDKTEYIFEYVIEDRAGNIFLYDTPDSRGYRYYKGRKIKKGTFMLKMV